MAFTHFDAGFPNELNYVAENVKNGRWQTRDDQDELAFVCSYDPSLTTTTAPSTSLPTSTISTTKPTTTTSVRTTTQWNAVTSTTLQQSTKRTGCPDGFTYFAPTQKCYIVVGLIRAQGISVKTQIKFSGRLWLRLRLPSCAGM